MATAEKYASALAGRESEAAMLRERIAELQVREQEALHESLKAAPSRRPFGDLNSPAAKARRAREKAEARLAGLEEEIPVLRVEAARAGREEAERFVAGQVERLRVLEAEEEAVRDRLFDDFLALARSFQREATAAVDARERLLAETVDGLVNAGDLRAEVERVWGQPSGRLLPRSLAAALEAWRAEAFEVTFADEPDVAASLNSSAGGGYVATFMEGAASALPNGGFGSGQVIRATQS